MSERPDAAQPQAEQQGDFDNEEYTDSAASSGSNDPEVQEHLQDQAEEGAAQGGKGRVQ